MVELPEAFVSQTRQLMGEERFARYLAAFDEEPPVSIRLNPRCLPLSPCKEKGDDVVPWCPLGLYLPTRPNFTFDPLLHAGCYYVQEAASMFIHHVLLSVKSLELSDKCLELSDECLELRDFSSAPHHSTEVSQLSTEVSQLSTEVSQHSTLNTQRTTLLDLCAAPGGKSTCAISALPAGSKLWSNEPVRQRASILSENIQKWGYPNCIVTNSYPRDYARSGLTFDIILCDVPCSGEGMFRKDLQTIGEWSPQQVEKCWRLQRDIVSDAWQCLRPGGILIYSTCTFNTKENEENVSWMLEQFDAELLPIPIQPEWGITGSLLDGFTGPVYRFIPGITRSEGLFVAVLRKKDGHLAKGKNKKQPPLNIIFDSSQPHDMPVVSVELNYADAISYLQRQALRLPADTPRGLVEVRFQGHALGLVKNIGTRANNLYPKEWAIRSTHVPQDYQPVWAWGDATI